MQETSNTHCLWTWEHRAWGLGLGGILIFCVHFALSFYYVHTWSLRKKKNIYIHIYFFGLQIFSRTRSGHNRCQDSSYKVLFLAFSVTHASEFSSWEFPNSGTWLRAVRGSHIQTEGHRGPPGHIHTLFRTGVGLGAWGGMENPSLLQSLRPPGSLTLLRNAVWILLIRFTRHWDYFNLSCSQCRSK